MGRGGGKKREREEREFVLNLNFILRMNVLGRGLIFQPVLLACTYNNDTIITLQTKNDFIDFHLSLHTQQAKVIDMALELSRLSVTK